SSKPQIKRVEIRRILPSTIIINVEEREPFAYTVYKGVYYEVDDEGVIIGKRGKMQELPLIIGFDSLSEAGKVKRGVRVLNLSKDLGFFFSKVSIKDENNIVGYLREEDIRVYIGKGERLNRLSFFPLILSDAENEGKEIEYIDIRFHNQIVVGLKTRK
ncbi:MAG: cell division protein FtsQ/DivIB, partial [Candidatus Aerophobetes bacterium]|nr:cell division protein FtsQ/DivIB [Candidatus Aerophobetes bacterium]